MPYTTDLSTFDNSWFKPGATRIKRILWHFVKLLFFRFPVFSSFGLKVSLLRLFGANVGRGVVIKSSVNIKYPWKLIIGNYVWIEDETWIDNLAIVTIGDNVCISEGAMLLCGNQNYKKSSFDLLIGAITLENGVWIGAKSIVCPGVICQTHSVLTVGSVAVEDLESFGVYQGNPAIKIRERNIIS